VAAPTYVIVDDHALFAEAVRFALDRHGFGCVGVATSAEEGLALVEGAGPDAVIVDVQLPDGDGVELARAIRERRPGTHVVLVTGMLDRATVLRAVSAPGVVLLPKGTSFDDLVGALRGGGGSRALVDLTVVADMLDADDVRGGRAEVVVGPGRRGARGELTARELEVLELMGSGLDPQAVAEELIVSIHTARGHVKNILSKLGARSQLEAVAVAHRQGILRMPATQPT
jgi:DNA-binding NarL/FixJ family response regulator